MKARQEFLKCIKVPFITMNIYFLLFQNGFETILDCNTIITKLKNKSHVFVEILIFNSSLPVLPKITAHHSAQSNAQILYAYLKHDDAY